MNLFPVLNLVFVVEHFTRELLRISIDLYVYQSSTGALRVTSCVVSPQDAGEW